MEPKQDDVDVLEVLDRVLSAALREVRGARARRPMVELVKKSAAGEATRKSQTSACLDILNEAGRPLHISALLGALDGRGVRTTRESLVSAISKKLAPMGPFVRTAPNTFGVSGRDHLEA